MYMNLAYIIYFLKKEQKTDFLLKSWLQQDK